MKIKNALIFLLSLLLFVSCKEETTKTETKEIVQVREWKPEDTRSLSGLMAPRGVIRDTDKDTPGYVLFEPSKSTFTYLIDKEGNVVHSWESELNSMNSYLLPNGNLIRLERDPDFPTFAAGGQAGRIREYSWTGDLLWDFEYANEKELLHHDIEIMPNGNVLGISYEVVSAEEAIALGMDPDKVPKAGIWLDKIVEIEPERPNGGKIVWEWHMKDHLIQDMFEDKLNYGDLAEHPRKINLNIPSSETAGPPMTEEQIEEMKKKGFMTSNASVDNHGSDISHTNAIAYNAQLDQIAISVPGFGEIYVVDHSTTTEEAKGETGGRWGHGGELLYRWGNAQNYGRGGKEDEKLYAQHDIKWIPEGYPGAGHLMVYNNDIPHPDSKLPSMWAAMGDMKSPVMDMAVGDIGSYSAVYEWAPETDEEGNYIISENDPFGPTDPDWSYTAPDLYSFYSAFISGAQRLENGHTLITEGMRGRFFEIDSEGEIVWEYWTPYKFDYNLPDGSPAQPIGPFLYAVFRSTLYPIDHQAFEDKEIKPLESQPEPFVFTPPPVQPDSISQP